MASTQVLPSSAVSSRKQGHLEAGKKRVVNIWSMRLEKQCTKMCCKILFLLWLFPVIVLASLCFLKIGTIFQLKNIFFLFFLALEKEELMRALTIESSNSSVLKDLNKDLSQKLEAQTQRLELLTSQRMANENAPVKSIDTHSMQDTTVYADEGDEVVARVLGWIIKLFPGGPTKRRTRKLL